MPDHVCQEPALHEWQRAQRNGFIIAGPQLDELLGRRSFRRSETGDVKARQQIVTFQDTVANLEEFSS